MHNSPLHASQPIVRSTCETRPRHTCPWRGRSTARVGFGQHVYRLSVVQVGRWWQLRAFGRAQTLCTNQDTGHTKSVGVGQCSHTFWAISGTLNSDLCSRGPCRALHTTSSAIAEVSFGAYCGTEAAYIRWSWSAQVGTMQGGSRATSQLSKTGKVAYQRAARGAVGLDDVRRC